VGLGAPSCQAGRCLDTVVHANRLIQVLMVWDSAANGQCFRCSDVFLMLFVLACCRCSLYSRPLTLTLTLTLTLLLPLPLLLLVLLLILLLILPRPPLQHRGMTPSPPPSTVAGRAARPP
jgi:hypothetical protein